MFYFLAPVDSCLEHLEGLSLSQTDHLLSFPFSFCVSSVAIKSFDQACSEFNEFNIPISAAVHSDIFLRVYIYFSFFRKKLKSQKSITIFFLIKSKKHGFSFFLQF